MPIFLGLDIGTTSTIGILIDADGGTLATAQRPTELFSPHANWAEEEPGQWWSNCCAIVHELLSKSQLAAGDIAAVGITGMVPALVLLDQRGRVLRRSIQQNDARAIGEIEAMRQRFDGREFFRRTGGSINQQLIAPKLRWIERHEPDVSRRISTVLGSYDYIAHRLTGTLSIEQNWALESGLMDFSRREFAQDLVAEAGIDFSMLPAIHRSDEIVGAVTP